MLDVARDIYTHILEKVG